MVKGYGFGEGGLPCGFELEQISDMTGVVEMSARPVPPQIFDPNYGHYSPAAVIIDKAMGEVAGRSSVFGDLNQPREGDK